MGKEVKNMKHGNLKKKLSKIVLNINLYFVQNHNCLLFEWPKIRIYWCMLISHYFPNKSNAPQPNNSTNPPPPPPRDGHRFCEKNLKSLSRNDSVTRSQKKNDFNRSKEWKTIVFYKWTKKKDLNKQTNLKINRFYWTNEFSKRFWKKTIVFTKRTIFWDKLF